MGAGPPTLLIVPQATPSPEPTSAAPVGEGPASSTTSSSNAARRERSRARAQAAGQGMGFYLIPPNRDKRLVDHEVIWGAVLPLTVLVAALWYKIGLPLPQCNFKRFTGLPCATCGGTRSAVALLGDFDVVTSFLMNPMVFFGFMVCGAYVIYAGTVLAFKLPRIRFRAAGKSAWLLRYLIAAVFLVNWAYLISNQR